MDDHPRRLAVVLAIGAIWAILWPSIGLAFMLVLTVMLGPNGDVGPVEVIVILGRLGLLAGIAFGAFVAILEQRPTIADVGLLRVIPYGITAAAMVGLVDGLQPTAIVNACVLGGLSAPATIALARAYIGQRPVNV